MSMRSPLTFVLVLTAAACAAPYTEEQDSHPSAATVDRSDRDVTILQAWIGETLGRRYDSGYQLGDRAIDLSRCAGHDCAGPAQELLESTLVGGFAYDPETSGQCETLEIRTVMREGAFEAPSFRGIGLYLSTVRGTVFVSKEELVARGDAGRVTLADGSRAIVHRLVARGMCFGLGGNGGSIQSRSYDMKPFAQFDADGSTYRVWDVANDYRLGRASDGSFVRSFDRQDELLAH